MLPRLLWKAPPIREVESNSAKISSPKLRTSEMELLQRILISKLQKIFKMQTIYSMKFIKKKKLDFLQKLIKIQKIVTTGKVS